MNSETDCRMTLSGTGDGGGNGGGNGGGGGSLAAGKVRFKKTEKDQFKKLCHDLTRGAPMQPACLETQGRKSQDSSIVHPCWRGLLFV
jgi:hypothetical protein